MGVWGDGTDLKFNLVGLPGDAGVTIQPLPLEADGKKTKLVFPFPLPSGTPLCTQVPGSAERSQFLMDQGLGNKLGVMRPAGQREMNQPGDQDAQKS